MKYNEMHIKISFLKYILNIVVHLLVVLILVHIVFVLFILYIY